MNELIFLFIVIIILKFLLFHKIYSIYETKIIHAYKKNSKITKNI